MPTLSPTHNAHAYTVSELSGALKRSVEERFGQVRVRGEISGFKRAASGHLYLDLKDAGAVLNAVCWKGTAARLAFAPEDGLEVICTGKLTTYGARSSYQLVIDAMEVAGAGALMALLEKRRQQLAAEGLFDAARKKPLPYLPRTIGVITSPTGAVIRDILHRIAERFPAHVLIWPVPVQGEGAAEQIAAAIEGFNRIEEPPKEKNGEPAGFIPRPDLLIVARGGGSLEDLWAFNEEIVVRAAANSRIPLISAVGHETDTTLIDYAADKRAPTPTAAAEMAVPVRTELLAWVREQDGRLYKAIQHRLEQRQERIHGLARGLPRPEALLAQAAQTLDMLAERLALGLPRMLARAEDRLEKHAVRLNTRSLLLQLAHLQSALPTLQARGDRALAQRMQRDEARLATLARMLESLDHQKVLARGFALVQREDGSLVTSHTQATGDLRLLFHDGQAQVRADTP